MNELVPQDADADAVSAETANVVQDVESAAQDQVWTGVEEVDAVLRSVEDLEGTPVEQHVAIFETAHERLRGALDGDA